MAQLTEDYVFLEGEIPSTPLTSDLLDSSYESVVPTDVNRLEIRLTDEAGNTVNSALEWHVEILVPDIAVTSMKSSNSTLNLMNWNSRAISSGITDESIEASFTNTSNKSVRVKIDENITGVLSQIYESGERENKADVSKGEEWQTNEIRHVRNIIVEGGDVFTSESCSFSGWRSAVSVDICDNGTCTVSQTYHKPAKTITTVNVESDNLDSLEIINNWNIKNDIVSVHIPYQQTFYSYQSLFGSTTTRVNYLNININLGGNNCPSTHEGFQTRYTEIPSQAPGFPKNNFNDIVVPDKAISINSLIVVDQNNNTLVPSGDFYTVAGNSTITVKLKFNLPAVTFYTDSEVENQASFSSYTEKFYDESFDWKYNVDLTLTSVFDAGTNSEDNYKTRVTTHNNTIDYVLNR